MVTVTAEGIKEELLATDPQFRELVHEHHKHEQRLSELSSIRYPSLEEQQEELILKRKKLLLKDQMQSIIEQRRRHHAGH